MAFRLHKMAIALGIGFSLLAGSAWAEDRHLPTGKTYAPGYNPGEYTRTRRGEQVISQSDIYETEIYRQQYEAARFQDRLREEFHFDDFRLQRPVDEQY